MEAFDPLFCGFPARSRWFIGEVAGELYLSKLNKHIFLLETGFNPYLTTTVAPLFLNIRPDENYA